MGHPLLVRFEVLWHPTLLLRVAQDQNGAPTAGSPYVRRGPIDPTLRSAQNGAPISGSLLCAAVELEHHAGFGAEGDAGLNLEDGAVAYGK